QPRVTYNTSHGTHRSRISLALRCGTRETQSITRRRRRKIRRRGRVSNGVLTIEIEEPNPGKIVISPQTPTRQIWISAQATSFKLDWSGSAFVFPSTGESLSALIGRLVGEQLNAGPIAI